MQDKQKQIYDYIENLFVLEVKMLEKARNGGPFPFLPTL